MEKRKQCPVCTHYSFYKDNDAEICPVCGWENDRVQNEDHNFAGGANALSVNEARIEYYLLTDRHRRARAAILKEEYKLDPTADANEKRREYVNKLNRLLNG